VDGEPLGPAQQGGRRDDDALSGAWQNNLRRPNRAAHWVAKGKALCWRMQARSGPFKPERWSRAIEGHHHPCKRCLRLLGIAWRPGAWVQVRGPLWRTALLLRRPASLGPRQACAPGLPVSA
jgi:hypothetical protein